MAPPNALILRAPGTNCDEETAHAWRIAGARPAILHINRLIEQPAELGKYQILTIPGGFSYGDDIASGKIFANQLLHHLASPLNDFVDSGGLILGICNGFQVLVRMGLLPDSKRRWPVTLTLNESGRYEDRWVRVRSDTDRCPFLRSGEVLNLPVAHAEGRVFGTLSQAQFAAPEFQQHIAMRYVSADGTPPNFPENPNGSIENAAALVNETGRVLGLMPHPERHIDPVQAPSHLAAGSTENNGLSIFRRAVESLR
jgi:phosphoribosylformylglycinamidine synthase I